jgi:L-proline amide hydrolase
MTTTECTTSTAGVLERDGLRTWFTVVGDPADTRPAIVLCHGGPGATHDYLASLDVLAADGRRCVFYDQVGSGRSSRHPDVPAGFWRTGLFVDELEQLVTHLALDRYHVLGQSWGAMLGLELALRHPAGMRSLVVANGMASVPRYVQEHGRLLAALPTGMHDALVRHGAAGTTDAPDFIAAIEHYSRLHRLRLDTMPAGLQRTNELMGADMSVYSAMVGSEFCITGTLRNWDVTKRLASVAVPVLVIAAQHDEISPVLGNEIAQHIPDAEFVEFHGCSHMTHLEAPRRFVDTVNAFINRVEDKK